MFGLGTWKSKPGEVRSAVKHAINIGYRHIDGAAAYFNETEVGEGIKDALTENTGLKREDIFIVALNNFWSTFSQSLFWKITSKFL